MDVPTDKYIVFCMSRVELLRRNGVIPVVRLTAAPHSLNNLFGLVQLVFDGADLPLVRSSP